MKILSKHNNLKKVFTLIRILISKWTFNLELSNEILWENWMKYCVLRMGRLNRILIMDAKMKNNKSMFKLLILNMVMQRIILIY